MNNAHKLLLFSYPRPELVANGAFDSDVTGWSAFRGADLSWQSGAIRVAYGGTAEPQARQTIATAPGRQYVINGVRTGGTGSGIIRAYAANGTTILASVSVAGGAFSLSFVATDSTSAISLGANVSVASYVEFDDISCRRT